MEELEDNGDLKVEKKKKHKHKKDKKHKKKHKKDKKRKREHKDENEFEDSKSEND